MRVSARLRRTRSASLTIALVTLVSVFAAMPTAAGSGAEVRAPVDRAVAAAMQERGKATYWVVLKDRANLGAASEMSWEQRGNFVVAQLKATANRSQAGLRGILRSHGADYTSYWVANVLEVTSDAATMNAIVARPEVQEIEADGVYRIPEPLAGTREATVQAVEWNISDIKADQVWSTFGDRGEGIVVGSIDTGAQFDHPAIVTQYRGNQGGGSFDHNYNWYDPSSICGSPSLTPCDNNGHGTHTMGTIVGDDGGANKIGVAPGARWITAKGCESSSCSYTALTLAGQWMLAPTNLSGQSPRSDLRPNIVSNSWGGGGTDTFFQQIVQSWVAAGIMPVFANGNSGPSCGTVGAPGSYPESYGVGAYDSADLIASFSSRGPSAITGGGIKPNISAPGVNVRSSVPPNSYAVYSGTSMATPHVAGVVALMWSAAPSLVADIATTRQILDQTAIDTADISCGGSPGNNNVYGEGRMDAFAAVDQSPRGPTGTLRGTVTDASSAALLSGISVQAASGSTIRTTSTDTLGAFSLTLPVGTYDVIASGFGYLTQTQTNVVITEGATTTTNLALVKAPSHALSGSVRDSESNAVANATVTILGTPIAPATTNPTGAYRFASVPDATYDVRAEAGRCNDPKTQRATLSGADLALDFTLPPRTDAFGYGCKIVTQTWVESTAPLALTGDDAYVPVNLPFNFEFYGARYGAANVSTNGYLTFVTPSAAYANTAIPSAYEPNAAVYALWDDLYVDPSSSVRTATLTSPNRFVVEWRNVAFYANTASRVDAEILLNENGEVLIQYRNVDPSNGQERGNSATLGLENAAGTDAFQYSFNEAVLFEGLSIQYRLTPFTGIEGRVTDANDGLGIAGATVKVMQGSTLKDTATTNATGYYRSLVPAGTYTVEASMANYQSQSANVNVTTGSHATKDFALMTPRLAVAPTSLAFNLLVGQNAPQTLSVTNTAVSGSPNLTWSVAESGGEVPWLSESPSSGTRAPGVSEQVTVTANAAGLTAGYYSATLAFSSNAGKQPTVQVPVSLSVTAYDQPVNVGGPGVWIYDTAYTYWAPDQAYVSGTWGYRGTGSTTLTTKHAITGAPSDQTLFQDQRVNPGEYWFDVSPGTHTYEVTLLFAELKQVKVGARVFDVTIEATQGPQGLDIRAKGLYTAYRWTSTTPIPVTDGQLNIVFTARAGKQPPVVNGIRVRQLS